MGGSVQPPHGPEVEGSSGAAMKAPPSRLLEPPKVRWRVVFLAMSLPLPTPWLFLLSDSLQDTLAYATALLNEKEQSGSSNGSESSPANENGDRHLQQVWPGVPVCKGSACSGVSQSQFHNQEKRRPAPSSVLSAQDPLPVPTGRNRATRWKAWQALTSVCGWLF